MAIVSLKIGPKEYKFSCADGQEQHMQDLAQELDKKALELTHSLGMMQEGQLLAMICLLLAEEKSRLQKETNADMLAQSETALVENLQHLALKITTLADNLSE